MKIDSDGPAKLLVRHKAIEHETGTFWPCPLCKREPHIFFASVVSHLKSHGLAPDEARKRMAGVQPIVRE